MCRTSSGKGLICPGSFAGKGGGSDVQGLLQERGSDVQGLLQEVDEPPDVQEGIVERSRGHTHHLHND